MTMIDRSKTGRCLPDGTHLSDTLSAASHCGLTPPSFKAAAKKAGLKRYATRGSRGTVSYLWITGEVEAFAAQRLSNALTLVADEVVEAPYDDGQA